MCEEANISYRIEETISNPQSELRADTDIADEPQEQFYNVDELIANLKNYDEWPTDPKKRVDGKKYIKKGKLVECISRGKSVTAKGTIEQTVIDCHTKHNGKYKYPIQEYVSAKAKMKIYCNKHKKYFRQSVDKHKNEGCGCNDCGREVTVSSRSLDTEIFIKRAIIVNGENTNGYEHSIYTGIDNNVDILCKSCNKIYQQTPHNHLRGKGCQVCGRKKCAIARTLTNDEFIKRVKKGQGICFHDYDYSAAEYIRNDIPVKIFCKKCKAYFLQKPIHHIQGHGCQVCGRKKCAIARTLTNDEFIKRVKKGQGICFHDYDYSAAEYIRNDIPVKIFCKKCELYFLQTPDSHIQGRGCIFCKNKTERKLLNFLTCEYPDNVEYQKNYDWCRSPETGYPYWFDYVVNENIIIELDGDQHIDKQVRDWKCPEEQQERDMYKMTQAINNEKHVIRILQRDVWNDTNNWEEKLIQAITELKDVTEPTIRFIGDCEVYKEYTIE